jgi:hypothetical protein
MVARGRNGSSCHSNIPTLRYFVLVCVDGLVFLVSLFVVLMVVMAAVAIVTYQLYEVLCVGSCAWSCVSS